MIHMATKVERRLKRKGSTHHVFNLGSLSQWRSNLRI
jgi:hypothetical protein